MSPIRSIVPFACAVLGWGAAGAATPEPVASEPAGTEAATPEAITCKPLRPELARGFSLTGWFDEPVARLPDFPTLKTLAARGMTHVRLPIAAESVSPRFTRASEIDLRRRQIETGIDLLVGLGYAVVVDLHGGARLEALLRSDPKAAEDAVVRAWEVLGPGIEKRARSRVMAEVLNEPPVSDSVWRDAQTRIVAAMRKTMPTTTLVVSTGGPQRVERLTASQPIADRNTVYAVHYYDPMLFTHQGAEWIRPDPIGWLRNVPFPTKAGDPRMPALVKSLRSAGLTRSADYLAGFSNRSFVAEDVRRDMDALGAWSRTHGRAVVIGEFGVYRPHVAAADRKAWLAAVTSGAAANCVGWTHWEYRDGFGLADSVTGRLDETTLSGLAGIAPSKGK